MNESPPTTTRPALDALTLLALAAGLAMGEVVRALAELSTASSVAMPSAIVFLVFGSAAAVCGLASVPRPQWIGPRFGLWITALGCGLLGALAPPLLF